MGAINPDRLEEFMERYETFSDTDIPKFMYGSHYSTMVGVVLHFLVRYASLVQNLGNASLFYAHTFATRLQPFADLHRNIQNGHFDVPDRHVVLHGCALM
jgi:hypothetical protein